MVELNLSPAEQLVEIYFFKEMWHHKIMNYKEALIYHQRRLDDGRIICYIEDGEVLGYYEREFNKDTCNLCNTYIKEEHRNGKVFKWLYKNFFDTMPKNIKYITGFKQKIGGKFQKVSI